MKDEILIERRRDSFPSRTTLSIFQGLPILDIGVAVHFLEGVGADFSVLRGSVLVDDLGA